jgi:hypothetical protein
MEVTKISYVLTSEWIQKSGKKVFKGGETVNNPPACR